MGSIQNNAQGLQRLKHDSSKTILCKKVPLRQILRITDGITRSNAIPKRKTNPSKYLSFLKLCMPQFKIIILLTNCLSTSHAIKSLLR